MKTVYFFSALLCIAAFVSCKKGDQGDPGVDGNANVVQYNFGVQNLQTGFAQLKIKTTQDTMNNSLWYVYLYAETVGRWYTVPGLGVGGATQYRTSLGFANDEVNIYIDKTGSGEQYSKARVIRVYTNRQQNINFVPGNRSIGTLDLSDYEAMRAHYNLPR